MVSVWLSHITNIGPLQLFVPAQTVLSVVTSKTRDGGNKRKIPWDAWGPGGTRLSVASNEYTGVWLCNVAGSKLATTRLHGLVGGTRNAVVYDFNQTAIRRALARGKNEYVDPADGVQSVCVTKKSIMDTWSPAIFKKTVVTSLPYRTSIKRIEVGTYQEQSVMGVMMTEDALVTVHSVRLLTLSDPYSSCIY